MEERNEFTPGPWKAFDVSEMHDEPRFMVGPREFCSIAEVRAGSTEAEETGDVAANARLIAAAPTQNQALKRLYHAYVSLLETGRDRIVSLGGDCDPVDVMERSDPALIEARSALLLANTGGTENG